MRQIELAIATQRRYLDRISGRAPAALGAPSRWGIRIVTLDNGNPVKGAWPVSCYKLPIHVVAGDRVNCALSPYHLSKGRVIFRETAPLR